MGQPVSSLSPFEDGGGPACGSARAEHARCPESRPRMAPQGAELDREQKMWPENSTTRRGPGRTWGLMALPVQTLR